MSNGTSFVKIPKEYGSRGPLELSYFIRCHPFLFGLLVAAIPNHSQADILEITR
jgi:hypothetical protein